MIRFIGLSALMIAVAGLTAGCQRSGESRHRTDPDPHAAKTPARAGAKHAAKQRKLRAVLVGCTNYNAVPTADSFEAGPDNDVRMLAELLTSSFDFPPESITTLAGWPDDPIERPTFGNIVRAIEAEVQLADEDTFLVVHLSGHGARQPIADEQEQLLDPENPEPDGMDEVFLPSDAALEAGGRYSNVLTDNQIREWVDKLRSQGAHTWMIFDCCHSGTLTKGSEIAKGVHPPQTRGKGISTFPVEASTFSVFPNDENTGTVVAFYAAQPFEETHVLTRPKNAKHLPENRYSLFTYSLVGTLGQERQRAITYRELLQELVTAHYSDWKYGPTPFCEGDIDSEVLGTQEFVGRSEIRLRVSTTGLSLNAGQLSGITPGTVLRVHPPDGLQIDGMALGYVRVIDATALTADVDPCDADGVRRAATFPDLSVCRIYRRAMSDSRLRLAFRDNLNSESQAYLKDVLGAMPQESQLIYEVAPTDHADLWIGLSGHRVTLSHPDRSNPEFESSLPAANRLLEKGARSEQSSVLWQTLQKIHTWNRVWDVAAVLSQSRDSVGGDFRCRFRPIAEGSSSGDNPSQGHRVFTPGQQMELVIDNSANQWDLWIAVVHLAADSAISVLHTQSVGKFERLKPLQIAITDDSFGSEGIAVFALNMQRHQLQPDFASLQQSGLGSPDMSKGSASTSANLLSELIEHPVGPSGAKGDISPAPVAFSYSWITRPVDRASSK